MRDFFDIQNKYMGGGSDNFYNNQNYCLGKRDKDLINYVIYDNNFTVLNPYGFFLKDELRNGKKSINFLLIISLFFSEGMVLFLYLGGVFSTFFELIIMLIAFGGLSLFPFLLFNSNIKIKNIILNSESYLAKCPQTKKWIIVYIKNDTNNSKSIQGN